MPGGSMVEAHRKRSALAYSHPAAAEDAWGAAAVLPDGHIYALKGPVARKTVEAFYFASKPYAWLHRGSGAPVEGGKTKGDATLPKHSIWAPVQGGYGGAAPDAAVLWLWYPEVKTLVAAYAGGRALEAEVATVSDDFATPFYLPDRWGATARQPYASAFNRLHGAPALVDGDLGDDNIQQAEKALHDSHDKLRALTGKQPPLRVLVTGYSAGGALATIAAPWLALAYPSADVRLITFGAPFVNSRKLTQLAEWSVGIRLRAVLKHDPALATSTSCAPPGLGMSVIDLEVESLEDNGRLNEQPRLPLNLTGAHTLAAYIMAVATFFEGADRLQTTGTGFATGQYAPGSFWGDENIAYQLHNAAEAVKEGARAGAAAGAEAVAVDRAAKFNVAGVVPSMQPSGGAIAGVTNGVDSKATVAGAVPPPPVSSLGHEEPGYVAAPFELVPGPCPGELKCAGVREGALTAEGTLQRLVAQTLVQPMRYARSAYAAEIIPNQFIESAKFPLALEPSQCPNVTLVSDPLSGANAYVCYHEPTGTAQLVFRGTELYSLEDFAADFDVFQVKAHLSRPAAKPAGPWARAWTLPGQARAPAKSVPSSDNATMHRGFLDQFHALAGGEDLGLEDLLSAMGRVRAWRWFVRKVFRALLPTNSGEPPSNKNDSAGPAKDMQRRNLAAVLHGMTGGRAPLRVLCTGHSLGGALATIASQWAALTFPDADVRCVTFGSPLVGNAEFVAAWRAVVGTRIRAVHAYDIVPSLPPSRVGPIDFHTFEHVYPAVWLRSRVPSLELHDVQLERPWISPTDQDYLLPRNIHDHVMRDGYCATMGKVLSNMGLEEESL